MHETELGARHLALAAAPSEINEQLRPGTRPTADRPLPMIAAWPRNVRFIRSGLRVGDGDAENAPSLAPCAPPSTMSSAP